jgi:hypothetical protein
MKKMKEREILAWWVKILRMNLEWIYSWKMWSCIKVKIHQWLKYSLVSDLW